MPDAVADDLVWLPMDLGVVDSVVRTVAKLKTMEQKVDILSKSTVPGWRAWRLTCVFNALQGRREMHRCDYANGWAV